MADTKLSLPDISTIQPDRLIKCRVSEDRLSAEVLLPGLSYTDFDKKIGGNWTLWSMAKVFESIRYSMLPAGFYYYNDIRDEDHSMFMASTQYHMTPLFNTIKGRQHWGAIFPMYAKTSVIHAGRSSFTFDTVLYDFQTGEKIITAYMTFVYMDFKTRRPTPFPEWLQTKSDGFANRPRIPLLEVMPIPEDAFSYETRSAPSDTDFNQHVNQSIYVKWCMDAGAEAAMNGSYPHFTLDIGKYPIKRIELRYIAEGAVNEDFVTHTWQDPDVPRMVHFVITKQGKMVLAARFLYFSEREQSML